MLVVIERARALSPESSLVFLSKAGGPLPVNAQARVPRRARMARSHDPPSDGMSAWESRCRAPQSGTRGTRGYLGEALLAQRGASTDSLALHFLTLEVDHALNQTHVLSEALHAMSIGAKRLMLPTQCLAHLQ